MTHARYDSCKPRRTRATGSRPSCATRGQRVKKVERAAQCSGGADGPGATAMQPPASQERRRRRRSRGARARPAAAGPGYCSRAVGLALLRAVNSKMESEG